MLKEIEEKYEAANGERKRLERNLHKKEAEMEQRVKVIGLAVAGLNGTGRSRTCQI